MCRYAVLRDLADVDAAQGTASHAIANVAHRRPSLWFTAWQRVALDADEQGRS
jgi:hypothetical protein